MYVCIIRMCMYVYTFVCLSYHTCTLKLIFGRVLTAGRFKLQTTWMYVCILVRARVRACVCTHTHTHTHTTHTDIHLSIYLSTLYVCI
jgi:hypothetical protein